MKIVIAHSNHWSTMWDELMPYGIVESIGVKKVK